MYGLIPGPREGWISVALLLAVVLSPAISLADAAWVEDLSIVPWLVATSLLLGLILAKLPVRGPVAYLFNASVGLGLTATYFAAGGEGSDWEARYLWLGYRVWRWVEAAIGGGFASDNMLFALLMGLAAWHLGHFAAWHTFRIHNVWPALVTAGLALMVNLSYISRDPTPYFLTFLFASTVLLVRLTLHEKERESSGIGDEDRDRLVGGFLWQGSLIAVGVVALAWVAPIGNVNAAVAENWYSVTGPWGKLQSEFERLFSAVGYSGKPEESRFGTTLSLQGNARFEPNPIMFVSSPRGEYWGTQTYDRYNGQGWLSTAGQMTRLATNDARLGETTAYAERMELEQHFKLLASRSSNVFAAGSPLRVSLPVYADYFDNLEELAALRPTVPLRQGAQYTVVSSVSVASADQLRTAGSDFPPWASRYLELPGRERSSEDGSTRRGDRRFDDNGSLRRVTALARALTARATNQYDDAAALERHLRTLRYDLSVTPPPTDRDAVDWFLFDSKEGYCDYFASAMAVMARAVRIPSRVVTGYNTGVFDELTGRYQVSEQNAHSWPELFFSGYGWIRFEPTPSQSLPVRAGTETAMGSQGGVAGDAEADTTELEPTERDEALPDGDENAGVSEPTPLWSLGHPYSPLAAATIAAVVLAALAIWLRILGRLSPAQQAYVQLCWAGRLLGLRHRPWQTPNEYGKTFSSASPFTERVVGSVVERYEEETYGQMHVGRNDDVLKSWRRTRLKLFWALLRRRMRKQTLAVGR